jgi:hypothetical protein
MVVNIQDKEILESIHTNYRLNYLKDTAMARFIDDNVLSTINILIHQKSQDIVNHVFYSKEILAELLSKMRSHEDMVVKHQAIEFFMEVCQLSKNLQVTSRYNFFEQVNSMNMIEILAETFNVYSPDINSLRFETMHEEEALVTYIVEKKDSINKF